MLAHEPIPIEVFVRASFDDLRVMQVIGNWKIEPGELQKLVIIYLKDMGVYHVEPMLIHVIRDTIIAQLQTSPEIIAMVKKAEKVDAEKQMKRHAE